MFTTYYYIKLCLKIDISIIIKFLALGYGNQLNASLHTVKKLTKRSIVHTLIVCCTCSDCESHLHYSHPPPSSRASPLTYMEFAAEVALTGGRC